jgi:hypothetical protein
VELIQQNPSCSTNKFLFSLVELKDAEIYDYSKVWVISVEVKDVVTGTYSKIGYFEQSVYNIIFDLSKASGIFFFKEGIDVNSIKNFMSFLSLTDVKETRYDYKNKANLFSYEDAKKILFLLSNILNYPID